MAELPVRKRIYYGMGGMSMNLFDLLVMQWLIVRYVPPDTEKHLMPAALFGWLYLLGRLTEGCSNPFIAHWSDGCRSRWGRRMPFIRLGIVPLALAFFLLFNPPIAHMHWFNVVYLCAVAPLYFLMYGGVVTPYLSLLPEITSDLKERVDITTFQSVFLMLSTAVAFTIMPGVLDRWGWRVFAGAATAITIAFILPVAVSIKEKPQVHRPELEKLSVFSSAWLALKNRPFRYVIAATGFYWFGLNGMIALVTYWVLVVLARSEGEVAKLMGPFLVMNILFFFVFNALAGKFGKYVMMLITFLASAAAMASLALVGRLPFGSDFQQTMFVISLFGAPAAGFMVLPFAMLADVVDYDERRTGRRREAIFFGVQGIVQKLFIGASVLTMTVVPFIRSDGSKVLRTGESVSFAGVYTRADAIPGEPPGAGTSAAPSPNSIRVGAAPDSLDAAWTLTGPDGFIHEGRGDAIFTDLPRGAYVVHWRETPGWTSPEFQPTPTPFGLKLMALLCGLFSLIAFVIFLRYPLRERDGRITVLREPAV